MDVLVCKGVWLEAMWEPWMNPWCMGLGCKALHMGCPTPFHCFLHTLAQGMGIQSKAPWLHGKAPPVVLSTLCSNMVLGLACGRRLGQSAA